MFSLPGVRRCAATASAWIFSAAMSATANTGSGSNTNGIASASSASASGSASTASSNSGRTAEPVKVYSTDLTPQAQIFTMHTMMEREFQNWDKTIGAKVKDSEVHDWKTGEKTKKQAATFLSPDDSDSGKVALITTTFVRRYTSVHAEYKAWYFFKTNPHSYKLFMQMADIVRTQQLAGVPATVTSAELFKPAASAASSSSSNGSAVANGSGGSSGSGGLHNDQLIIQRIEVIELPPLPSASDPGSTVSAGAAAKQRVLFASESKDKVKAWVTKNIDLNDHKRMARITIHESGVRVTRNAAATATTATTTSTTTNTAAASGSGSTSAASTVPAPAAAAGGSTVSAMQT